MLSIIYPNRWFLYTVGFIIAIFLILIWQISLYNIEQDFAFGDNEISYTIHLLKKQKAHSLSQNSNFDTSKWKTYRNEKYGFEIQYPTDWSHDEQATRPYVIFGPAKQNHIDIYFSVDLGCVYATGAEDVKRIFNAEKVVYGGNVFNEEKVFIVINQEKILEFHAFTFDLSEWYKRQVTDDCKSGAIIVHQEFDRNNIINILSNFRLLY